MVLVVNLNGMLYTKGQKNPNDAKRVKQRTENELQWKIIPLQYLKKVARGEANIFLSTNLKLTKHRDYFRKSSILPKLGLYDIRMKT